MSNRVLVVAPSWIGDMMMAQPLLGLLDSQGYKVDVLALPWIKKLLARMPSVSEVIDMPLGHGQLGFMERRQVGHSLRFRYARSIVLPNSLKSALIPFFASIRERIGFIGEMRYGLLSDRRTVDEAAMPRLAQRYYSLGLPAGSEIPEKIAGPGLSVSRRQQQAALQAMGLGEDNMPFVALCPGAEYGPAKRWPAENYAALGRRALDKGLRVWLFGSDKDGDICAAVDRGVGGNGGRCVNLAGKTDLAQAVDLISMARAVVSNDSGMMHIAAALGVKTVALFGSTSPDYTPPLSDSAEIINLNLECSPCFERECPLGHLNCLRQITVERVSQSVGL